MGGLIGMFAQKMALKDGKISMGEQCGLNLISFTTGMAWLGEFGLAIWGSVVVFGAYSTWTYEEAVDETFCDYTCFMFAFVLLILRGHNAFRHLLWLHEADVQRLSQGSPGQLRWKFWNPVQFNSKKRTFQDHPRTMLLKL